MAAASLSGSSVPIFANPADEPVAVMVICPNKGSHQRLMQVLNTIVPDAFVPTPQPETRNAYIAGFEPNEDGVISCPNGMCGVD